MKIIRHIASFLLTLFFITGYCQEQAITSLWADFKNTSLPDTVRLQAIDDMAWNYVNINPDSAILLADEQLKFVKELKAPKVWAAKAYSTQGAASMLVGNYPKALQCYLNSLKVNEEIGSVNGIAAAYNNLGLVYQEQRNYEKAKENYFKCLAYCKQTKNVATEAGCYNNIGVIYSDQGKLTEALLYYFKGFDIVKLDQDSELFGNSCNLIANALAQLGKEEEAMQYYVKALRVRRLTGNENGRGIIYLNIGALYIRQGKLQQALVYTDSALKIFEVTGDVFSQRAVHSNYSEIHSKRGDYEKAFEAHVKFKQMNDSVFNMDNSRQLSDLKTQFEVEKKEAELKARTQAQEAVNNVEKRKQRAVIGLVSAVLLIVLIFSVLLYKRFKITKGQKQVIEEQKELVDMAYNALHEKNKEMVDSINYARRIQRSLLPTEKYISRTLKRLMK